jgi:aminomethyltransferase
MVQNTLPDDPNTKPLQLTPLDAWHRQLGARMTEFAGYAMPVQYDFTGELASRCKGGVLGEHLHCRAAASLFDVSHMGQAMLSGVNPAAGLERLVPGDMLGLKPGRQRYTVLTNEAGGILDDLMVANLGHDRLFLVMNASRKEDDLAHLAEHLPAGCTVAAQEDRALIALQGPAAAAVLSRLCPDAAALRFMDFAQLQVGGIPCFVSRSGYTGEDGFEISVPAAQVESLADRLLEQPEVAPAGLGARDSLRLEAGLCLHGNDIDDLTTPVEAGLAWTIGKRRRRDWDFMGAQAIRDQLENGPHRLRAGIRLAGRAPARAKTDIIAEDGTAAGTVTSGSFSPTLNAPVAMGYVRKDLSQPGTLVQLMVRGRPLPATVTTLPFVPHRYAT